MEASIVTTHPEFNAPCGLYCGVCAIHIADRDNNLKLKEKLVRLYQGLTAGKGTLPNSQALTVDDIRCQGCLSEVLFMHCRQCPIRDCALVRGYEGCHQCADFPCRHIDDFPMTVGKKVITRCVPYRREVGTEQWVLDEEARHHCPQCGHKVFRGAMKCNQCHTSLDLD
jgi:DNA-directed RNA polymerase subunit RPC12/RpoP